MQNKQFRVGLIGFGNMGRTHAWCIRNIPFFFDPVPFSVSLEALCTAHHDKTRSVCGRFGIPKAYDDVEALINDPDIDIIDICTPNILHYDALQAAVSAKKSIYCEKPLCVSAKEADEIVRLTQASPVKKTYGIVFHNRFFAACLKAKELIDQGRLGKILQFRVDYLHNSCLDLNRRAGWKQDQSICGGGVLFDLGSHALDLLTHLAGPVKEIFGRSQIAFKHRLGVDGTPWETNADEAFYMLLTLQNGATGTVTVSKISSGTNDDLSFYIGGEKGALRWSLAQMDILEFFEADASVPGFVQIPCFSRYPEPSGFFPSPKAPAGWLRAHLQSYYSFLTHVNLNEPADPSFEQGAYIQHLMEAAYRSAEINAPVTTVGRETP